MGAAVWPSTSDSESDTASPPDADPWGDCLPSSPSPITRRRALATMQGAVGLGALLAVTGRGSAQSNPAERYLGLGNAPYGAPAYGQLFAEELESLTRPDPAPQPEPSGQGIGSLFPDLPDILDIDLPSVSLGLPDWGIGAASKPTDIETMQTEVGSGEGGGIKYLHVCGPARGGRQACHTYEASPGPDAQLPQALDTVSERRNTRGELLALMVCERREGGPICAQYS